MITAAASSGGGAVFGVVGAGGLALALTVLMVLGVMGRGKLKLSTGQATVVAFLAGTAYVAAGKIWANPQRITEQGLTGLGVGSDHGPFGAVGVGAIALILLIVMLTAAPTPAFCATVGMIAAFVWPATGDGTIWSIPVQLSSATLLMVGA